MHLGVFAVKRREFIRLFGATLFVIPLGVHAQVTDQEPKKNSLSS